MRLSEHRYNSIAKIAGQLLFLEHVEDARAGEVVHIERPDGNYVEGVVLEVRQETVLIQVYGTTQGLHLDRTQVVLTDKVKQVPLSEQLLGRRFNGSFQPIDGLPMFIHDELAPVSGYPMNPIARQHPVECIETGISAIDGMNTLVKGQKLPIFSGAGLPSKELVAHILRHARVGDEASSFAIVFAAMGLTHHEYSYYMETLEGVSSDIVAFINLASDPVMERLLVPRFALTVAEYLAFKRNRDVLVIMTDMTNYCDAMREISTAREELPGRRGYPGYMYSDLASLYERAGRIHGVVGSVTQLPVLTMPEDDITHPIPDLTGYITEGQIVLSRDLQSKALFPPIDVLPSLSRLMQKGIGEGKTRADHRRVSNQLYRHYAMGRDLRKLEAIVGRDGMLENDRVLLDFADAFERRFVHQGDKARTMIETLDVGIALMREFKLAF